MKENKPTFEDASRLTKSWQLLPQSSPVQVFRLIGEETVEEGMQIAATKKLFLEKEVTSGCDDDEKNVKTVTQLLKESLGL